MSRMSCASGNPGWQGRCVSSGEPVLHGFMQRAVVSRIVWGAVPVDATAESFSHALAL
jgi:hypothetical protein